MADENLRLRAALRDLVALSTIPAGWIGIAPRTIASGLADILAGSLGFDFAFVPGIPQLQETGEDSFRNSLY
jgi:hypothetical protein